MNNNNFLICWVCDLKIHLYKAPWVKEAYL